MNLVTCLVLMAALLFSGCRGEQPAPQRAEVEEGGGGMVIVAMGDSLTAGHGVSFEQSYPSQLEKKLNAAGYPCRVVNAGVSAETSSGALARLDWVLTMDPDIVILETGANDGLRGIDPQVAEDNIRRILGTLHERGITVVLAGMRMVRNLGPEYVARFDGIYPRLARESGVVFMPFFLQGVAMEGRFNLEDGIHPNAAGYGKVVENLFPYVVQAIEKHRALEKAGGS
jgi:acyl-CoA thioesterase-1